MDNLKLEYNKIKVFNELLINFEGYIYDDLYWKYINFEKAVKLGIVNLDNSIIKNIEEFMKNISTLLKDTPEFKELLEHYNNFYQSLKNSNKEVIENFYNKSIIEAFLSRKLLPYEQVDLTNMYFNNTLISEEEKLDFLHSQINAILNGGYDFRIINALDKVKIDPKILKQDAIYQNFMDYLVYKYLIDYDKKEKNEFNDFIIRMIYRHQNRGYYMPDNDVCNEIVYAYAYNMWYKNLNFMITNNKLGITKENYELMKKYIIVGIEDQRIDSDMSMGEYILAYEKINKILTSLAIVAEENMKLSRKEG